MAYTPDDWTDKELEALEKRIAQVFRDAEKDLDKEVREYFAKFKLRDEEMQKLVQTGDMTQAEYQQWRMTQIGRGKRFEALRDKVAERYTKANEVANAYVNDATPSIYSLNRNYEAYTIEKTVGDCDFTMWDESTVRRLLVEEPDLMPYYPPSRALNRGIDLAYGKSQITKHVTSGIIRGLAPGKIANELMANISTMNRVSAVRAARTGITAAQNAGRMDSYVAAEKMGIKIRRKWMCTKDARTRLAHGMADGQIVEGTKKPFKVGGELMMFPGDQSMGAHGWNIYNCRCTTRTVEKDGIEAEPRETRVRNPKWEEAKAEEDDLSQKLDKLKEREQAETDPEKRKQLRQDRIKAQKELAEATRKRQGLDKNLVVPEMSYSEWMEWKKTGKKPVAKSGNGGTMKAGKFDTPVKTNDPFYNSLIDKLGVRKIDYVPVAEHTKKLSHDEIINAVAGGDMTVGSCASVGLAYIGQKNGWNVLDFRDGKSRDWFSGKQEKLNMWKAVGATVITEDSAKSNITNGKRILAKMEIGKEYYLSVGRHAAVVRAIEGMVKSPRTGKEKPGKVFQYLELQSSKNNGWQNFDGNPGYTLKTRFGCTSSSWCYEKAHLTEIGQLENSDEFRSFLGFLNTAENEQRKGKHGAIK